MTNRDGHLGWVSFWLVDSLDLFALNMPKCLCSLSQISIKAEETKPAKIDKLWGSTGNHGHWRSNGVWTRSAVFTFFYCRQFLAPRLMSHCMGETRHGKDVPKFWLLVVEVTMGNPCPEKYQRIWTGGNLKVTTKMAPFFGNYSMTSPASPTPC